MDIETRIDILEKDVRKLEETVERIRDSIEKEFVTELEE